MARRGWPLILRIELLNDDAEDFLRSKLRSRPRRIWTDSGSYLKKSSLKQVVC